MKLDALLPHIAAGHLILVAEFRGGKVSSSGFVDKETGLATKTLQVTYAVERQGVGMCEKVILNRYLPPDVTAEQFEIKLVKGCVYAFVIEKYEQKRMTFFGRMSAMEPVMIDKEEGDGAPAEGGCPSPSNLVYNQTTPQGI